MLRYSLCALIGVMAATTAAAQTPPDAASAPTASALISTEPSTSASSAAPLSLDELEDEHGRQGVTIRVSTNQSLTATNRNNTITAGLVDSGDISISDGAFAGFSGVGNFVVNSGHNNNLQGSLSINIVTP